MTPTILPLVASSFSSRLRGRTQSVRLIGPLEPQCPPLRLLSLRGTRIVELHQPEVVLGRHSDADLQLLEADVSRFHCRFLCVDEQWEIEDLGSLNGTHVNGAPVAREALKQGDVIRVADFLLQVDLGAPREVSLAAEEEARRSHRVLQSIAALLPEADEVDLPLRKSA